MVHFVIQWDLPDQKANLQIYANKARERLAAGDSWPQRRDRNSQLSQSARGFAARGNHYRLRYSG